MLQLPLTPLQFSHKQEWYVERRLLRYGGQFQETLGTPALLERLVRRPEWYGVLSAEGSGKTTLLNEIAYRLSGGEHNLIVIDLNLEMYGRIENIEQLLREIDATIRVQLNRGAYSFPRFTEMEHPMAEFEHRFEDLVRTLSIDEPVRLLLLFDDFQKLQPKVAYEFSAQLRRVHEHNYRDVTCIIAGDDDLETIQRNISPLKNIVETYTLADFKLAEVVDFLERSVEMGGPSFTESGRKAFWEYTRGYPALCWRLLNFFQHSHYPVDEEKVAAASQRLIATGQVNWLQSAFTYLQQEVHGAFTRKSVLYVLNQLLDGEEVPLTQSGTNILIQKGILRPDNEHVAWRNLVTEQFFRARREEMVTLSHYEPPPGRTLLATGTIHVSLVLNLRHFVEDKDRFDRLRGSSSYELALDALAEHVRKNQSSDNGGLFHLDEREEHLLNIAADLNIFRYASAKAAFSPIYKLLQAKQEQSCFPSSTLPQRLPEGEDPDAFIKALKAEWKRWHRKSIQFTPDGLVHIRLEQDFEESSLLEVLVSVLGLERDPAMQEETVAELKKHLEEEDFIHAQDTIRQLVSARSLQDFRERLDRSLQWEIAMALIEMGIADLFAEVSGGHSFPNQQLPGLVFVKKGVRENGRQKQKEDPVYPLHDRYVTYMFTKLCDCTEQPASAGDQCNNYSHNIITWSTLQDESNGDSKRYGSEISSLLEGVVVNTPQNGNSRQNQGARFPETKEREIEKVLQLDLSSWEAELCLVSQDNAIIYYHLWNPLGANVAGSEDGRKLCRKCDCWLSERIQCIHFSNRPNVFYDDYWRCINRGFEYLVNLRLLARLVATTATDDLSRLADFIDDENNPDRQTVQKLRERVATNTRLLARLRDVTTPLFIARADYATRKFDYFIKISGIKETIHNAEEDIQAINTFLQHYDEMAAQHRGEQLSRLFSIIAVILSLLAIPSFLVDLEDSMFGSKVLATHPLNVGFLQTSLLQVTQVAGFLFAVSLAGLAIYFSRRAKK